MKVYIVIEEYEDADNEGYAFQRVMGVYDSKEKALKELDRLSIENARIVAEFDCDKCNYWMAPYDVQ